MAVPVPFMDITEYEQTFELKNYLASLKIDVPQDTFEEKDWAVEFVRLIESVQACFAKEDLVNDDFSELIMTIATIILELPPTNPVYNKAISNFCHLYTSNVDKFPERVAKALYSLDILFRGVNEQTPERFVIFLTLLDCAHKLKIVNQITTEPEFVESWLRNTNCSLDQCRTMWRKLYEIHLAMDDNKKAFNALVRLLSTFSETDAAKAREDAIKCILIAINDPSIVIYEQLLTLSPIQFIEGEPVHNLLQIFATGDSKSFDAFVKKNAKLLTDNKLSEKDLRNKIRVLNFMQLAENTSEMDYEEIKKLLNLPSDEELREFIINVVRLKCVICKMDEMTRKVIIVSALPRSFGPEQWKSLLDGLLQWKAGIEHVNENLHHMLNPEAAQ